MALFSIQEPPSISKKSFARHVKPNGQDEIIFPANNPFINSSFFDDQRQMIKLRKIAIKDLLQSLQEPSTTPDSFKTKTRKYLPLQRTQNAYAQKFRSYNRIKRVFASIIAGYVYWSFNHSLKNANDLLVIDARQLYLGVINPESPLHDKIDTIEFLKICSFIDNSEELALIRRIYTIETTGQKKQCPLHISIISQDIELYKYLLRNIHKLSQNGKDINRKDSGDNTPLHLIASKDLKEFYDLLMEKNPELDHPNKDWNTPLDLAVPGSSIKKDLMSKKAINGHNIQRPVSRPEYK